MSDKLTFEEWFFQCEFHKDGYDCNQVSSANSAWSFCRAQEQKEIEELKKNVDFLLKRNEDLQKGIFELEDERDNVKLANKKAINAFKKLNRYLCDGEHIDLCWVKDTVQLQAENENLINARHSMEMVKVIREKGELKNKIDILEKENNSLKQSQCKHHIETMSGGNCELKKKVDELEGYKKQNDVDLNAMQAYVDRNFELQSENAVLKEGLNYKKQENESIKKKLEKAEKVIQFYGDPEKWMIKTSDHWTKSSPRTYGDSELIEDYSHPNKDWVGSIVVGGKRARAYLKENKG